MLFSGWIIIIIIIIIIIKNLIRDVLADNTGI